MVYGGELRGVGELFLVELGVDKLSIDSDLKGGAPASMEVERGVRDQGRNLVLELTRTRGVPSRTAVLDIDGDHVSFFSKN